MRTATLAAFVLACAVAGATSFGAEVMAKGKVDAVTVYRGQALVTRVIDMPAATGLSELVVSDLPERLNPGSLFAEGGEGVEVRSVQYRERPVAQDVREEVRKLDDAIQALADKLAANQKQLQVLGEQRAYLDKLQNFAAPTANAELTKGVLNADQLKNLTNYQFETRKAIADQELKLQIDARELQKQSELLNRQRAEVTGKSSRTLREAVVFIQRDKAGGSLRLRYLVDGASWDPSYNIRADAARKNAALEYQASIEQMSGEDWTDVAMTLSTASPNLVAAAPTLQSLKISLASAGSTGGIGGLGSIDYRQVQKGLSEQRANAEFNRNISNGFQQGGGGRGGNQPSAANMPQQSALNPTFGANNWSNADNDKALNKVADQMQVLELVTRDTKGESRAAPNKNEGVVVTYTLAARTSLPSRSDRQLIQIDRAALKGDFYKIAVPVLTSYVYDEATFVNGGPNVLLGGPVASYVGGQFVGSGAIETVAVGQPFTVGFGIDSSLRATRERLDKTEQTQGGNRVVSYTYKIAIENFGTNAAAVRIMDRHPVGKESEVRVTFDDAANVKLSEDREYQANERKNGILRWDVQVPAQKNGSEAFSLTYKLRLEHDKNLTISTAGLLGPELQQLLQQ